MKLNLGCGFNKLAGYLNVDKEGVCAPDAVVDLEAFPWPWADDSVTEIVASHALEHLGADTRTWFGVLKEIWRVGVPGCPVRITVPHPNHENFLHDPTHVRVVTPVGLAMFDQLRNLADLEAGGQESKLGLYSGIDLRVTEVGYDLCEPWRTAYMQGRISQPDVEVELLQKNNVCLQIRIGLQVMKPCRGDGWQARRAASV